MKQHVYQLLFIVFWRRTFQLEHRKQRQRMWVKEWLKTRLDFSFANLLRKVEMSVLVHNKLYV